MSDTPVSLLEVIAIVGEAVALRLVARFGGQTVRLPAPKNISAEHPLAQCIGVAPLTELVKITGGGRWLYVAKCYKGMIRQRNMDIVKRYSAGEPVNALARCTGLSDRQIWNILGSTVVDDGQAILF